MALIQRNGLLLFMIPIFCALQPTCSAVLGGQCTSDGECTGTVPNSACSASTCSCAAGYKVATGQCVKVITESCTTNAECTGTVTNSECSTSTCSCVAGYKEANDVCVKDTACTHTDPNNGDAKCKKQGTNTVCSAQNTCVCDTDFHLSPDGTNCVQKITTAACTPKHATDGDTKCQLIDAHSECKTGTACTCKLGYTGPVSCTKGAVTATTCTNNGDCTPHAHSECDTAKEPHKCKCADGFQEDSNDPSTCVKIPDALTACTVDGDCNGQHLVCDIAQNPHKCKCADGFQDDSNDKTTCVKIPAVLDTACPGGNDDCTAANSECVVAGNPGKCKCSDGFRQDTKDHTQCKKELGQACSEGECLTNAECDTTCKCSDEHIEKDGLCVVPSSTIKAGLSEIVMVMWVFCVVILKLF